MNRYIVLILFSILFSCQKEKRANILFFITDDESWIERSAYGFGKIPTPYFDQVAEEGILFTNAFTSAPSCAPSRASVLTGRNFWELEQGAFIQAFLPKKFPVFTDILAKNGYYIGNTQKTWGPGVHIENGHSEVSGVPFNEAKIDNKIEGIVDNDYAANFDLFLKARKMDQPFFFWAGLSEPHLPNGSENYKRLEEEFGITLDQIQLFPGVEDTRENRQDRANYIYEICYADMQLGRMLESLKAIGELDNTLVVVTSDNGTPILRGEKQVGKASGYDLGVHEPLAIMWPSRVKAGRKVSDFVCFTDFAPTFLEVAEIKPPADMSGSSLLRILESKKSGRIEADRNSVVTGLEWHGEFDPDSRSSRSIRDDRFAYIVSYNNVDENGLPLTNIESIKPAKVEFYDLINDPWQLNDLSKDPAFADDMQRLANEFRQYGMLTKDPRVTGEMDIFTDTRQYVQKRKRIGYGKTLMLPFSK
ncbi:sulfatase family protein [Maribellus maritimus]|uniref:sulfatase family protein n=1 Tax=Maribellus maritimus TaxID=2870838 RepID=UPI001EEB626A|nr:sulfatase [Maribellus maritimus]MCG6190496.1 sulfatase [Maribellus maritimus]